MFGGGVMPLTGAGDTLAKTAKIAKEIRNVKAQIY
jgi:hypothetical protein